MLVAHDTGDFGIVKEEDAGAILVYCQWDVEIVDCHGGKGTMMGDIEDNTGFVISMGCINQPEWSSVGIADVRK